MRCCTAELPLNVLKWNFPRAFAPSKMLDLRLVFVLQHVSEAAGYQMAKRWQGWLHTNAYTAQGLAGQEAAASAERARAAASILRTLSQQLLGQLAASSSGPRQKVQFSETALRTVLP